MAASNLNQNSTAHTLPCTALLHVFVQDHLRRPHKSGDAIPQISITKTCLVLWRLALGLEGSFASLRMTRDVLWEQDDAWAKSLIFLTIMVFKGIKL